MCFDGRVEGPGIVHKLFAATIKKERSASCCLQPIPYFDNLKNIHYFQLFGDGVINVIMT
jgi:hypothetical protein